MSVLIWGIVMYLFERDKKVLQPSLGSSMTFLYHDSNRWDRGWRDFVPFEFPYAQYSRGATKLHETKETTTTAPLMPGPTPSVMLTQNSITSHYNKPLPSNPASILKK